MLTIKEITGRLVILRVEMRSYSGKQTLSEDDLGTTLTSQLPPKELANLGFKRVLPPEELKPFNAYRQEASRACFSAGPRIFGDAFAIPEEKIADLMEVLEAIKVKWNARRDSLVANYDTRVATWADAHPKWRSSILASAPTAEYVKSRISFEILPFRIAADETVAQSEAYLSRELLGLSGKVIAEIAVEARAALKDSLTGRDMVTQRAVNPLKKMIDKADGMAFLDTGISGLVDHMRSVLVALPMTGPIRGAQLASLTGLMMLLSDPARVHAQVYAAHTVADTTDDLFDSEEDDTSMLPVVRKPAPPVRNIESAVPVWAF
jgi:hypothetical protein